MLNVECCSIGGKVVETEFAFSQNTCHPVYTSNCNYTNNWKFTFGITHHQLEV